MAGKNSRVNHTETALGAGATFTGDWESVVQYSSIRVSVITDQNGTLYIDTSPNQTAADETLSYSITAGAAADYSIDVTRRYFRLRFTNTAGSAQTYIRLNALLSDGIATTSSTVAGTVSVSNFPATQPISAASLPLPTGAATSAKQDTAQTTLSSIDTKLSGPVSVNSTDKATTGSITALDGVVSLAVGGMSSATLTLTGTFSATVVFEGSGDGGTTWSALLMQNVVGSSVATSVTNTGIFRAACAGMSNIRARASAYTSGTIGVAINAGLGSALNTMVPVLVTGSDGGTYRVPAVKAASTAPQATDPSMVVGLSPNSGHATAAKQDSIISEMSRLGGVVLSGNSSTAALNASTTFTGTGVDVSEYASVVVAVKTDQDGMLYMEFSPDNTNWDSSLSFSTAAGVNEVHRLSITRRYFRVRFTNTSVSNQTYFRLQALAGAQSSLTSALNTSIQGDADALISKSVLFAASPSGEYTEVPSTPEGHLEMAIHGPLTPFGSVHTERMAPVLQIDGVYGINTAEVNQTTSASGTVTAANNLITCSTGTTSGAYATAQSRRRVRYRPGQGIEALFTALWSTPVANSIVVAGLGSAESGYYFGYNGTSFGILHVTGGVREIQTLTVTTASTATNNYNVTLNGTTTNVTATNNGSTARTAYEISRGTYPGWTANAVGSTVVFLANDAGNKAGSFSLAQSGAGTPAAGSFAETLAGAASTDTWVTQASWNVDPLDGTGPSGFTIDPQKGNIFAIDMQYLGFGVVNCYVETTSTTNNNPTWTRVHSFLHPNTRTTPHVSQPSMPITFAAYSAGSTTNVSVSTASFAGFVEGDQTLTGPRMTYTATSTAVSTGSYYALATIRNDSIFKGRANQATVRLLSIGMAHDDATPVYLFLLKNATLVGTPNFASWSATSCTSVDTAATTATISDNNQIITSIPVGDAGNAILEFRDAVTLQPGESVTLAARTVTGTATYTIMSLNTREDQ